MVTDRDRSVVRWVAVIGAVSAGDVMARFRVGRTAGYRRLSALVEHGLLARSRLVYGQPTLYTATRDGLAWAGMPQVEPARVGVATTRHWATCARLAVKLERAERFEVWGEPRLHAAELEAQGAIASAKLGHLPDGRPRLRRPDLVLFPSAALPVAVEVELSVKGARRLEAICRAWARCRIVSEVRYYAPAHVARAVSRAVSSVRADDAIESCRSMNRRRFPLFASPFDPMVHMLTTLALTIGAATRATLSTVMFLRWLGLHWTWTLPGVLLGPLLWPFDQGAAGFVAATALFATATGARWHHDDLRHGADRAKDARDRASERAPRDRDARARERPRPRATSTW